MALLDFRLDAADPNNPNSVVSSPTDIARRRALADALAKGGMDYSPVQSKWQGVARLGQALVGALQNRQADADESFGRSNNSALLSAATGIDPNTMDIPATPGRTTAALSAADARGDALADAADGSGPAVPGAALRAAVGGGGSVAVNPNDPLAAAKASIRKIESDGSGGYSALGPVTRTGDRAYGAYQVMGANIPSWTQEALGKSMTPAEFRASPEAQEKVFEYKFGQNMQKYGPADAASIWLTGRPLAAGGAQAADQNGTTGAAYAQRFVAGLGGAQPGAPALAAAGPSMASAPAQQAIAGATGAPASLPVPSGAMAAAAPQGFQSAPQAVPSPAPQVPQAPAGITGAAGGSPAPAGPQAAGAAVPPQAPLPAGSAPGGMSIDPQALIQYMSDPYTSPQMQQVAAALLKQQTGGGGATTNPALVNEYNFAKKNGFDGSFPDYIALKGKGGATAHVVGKSLVGPDGKVLYHEPPDNSAATTDADTVESLAQSALAGDKSWTIGLSRSPGLIAAVRGRIAAIGKERGFGQTAIDILQNQANQIGRGQEQRTLGSATANNTLYGNAAASTMDTAIQASRDVPRSTWMPVNQILQAGQRAMSDPKLAAFVAATTTLSNDYSKAVTPSGTPTDAAREHAREMLNTAQSPEAYEAVVKMMRFEIENTHRAIEHTKQELRSGQPGTVPPTQSTPGGPGAASLPLGTQIKSFLGIGEKKTTPLGTIERVE